MNPDAVWDGSGDRRRRRRSVNVGHPIVTTGILSVWGGDEALPKLL